MQIKISNSQLENIHSQISHDYHSRGYDAALDSLNAHIVNYLKIDMDKVINSVVQELSIDNLESKDENA